MQNTFWNVCDSPKTTVRGYAVYKISRLREREKCARKKEKNCPRRILKNKLFKKSFYTSAYHSTYCYVFTYTNSLCALFWIYFPSNYSQDDRGIFSNWKLTKTLGFFPFCTLIFRVSHKIQLNNLSSIFRRSLIRSKLAWDSIDLSYHEIYHSSDQADHKSAPHKGKDVCVLL